MDIATNKIFENKTTIAYRIYASWNIFDKSKTHNIYNISV